MGIIKSIKAWRDKRFRERIDRVYFHTDGHGNRFIKGSLYAVADEETGQGGCLTANLQATLEDTLRDINEAPRSQKLLS